MKKISALAAIFLLCSSALAHTFSSPDHRYSVTAPDDWTLRGRFPGADLMLNVPGTAGSVNLITTVGQALPTGMDLAGYAKATLDALPGMMNSVKLTSQRKMTVAGLPAQELRFTGRNRVGNRPVYGQVILLVKAGRGYTLSYLGETPHTPAIGAAIDGVLSSLSLAR